MLEEIVAHKRAELAETKLRVPLDELLAGLPDPPPGLGPALARPGVNVIAEIKYRSPSHGEFRSRQEPLDLARLYRENGAVALSVLTEERYFGGSLESLEQIGRQVDLPRLRKDFIVDRYQVVESRARSASACLLIASCLERPELADLLAAATDFGLEALVEVHDRRELEKALRSGACLLGVNNRNLRTFEVDIGTSFDLARALEGESGFRLVSESGITERSQILELRDAGFDAFLIGSALMDAPDPGARLRELVGEVE